MEVLDGQLFLFVLCLFGSAFYSGSEAVIISISVERAKQLMDKGGSTADALDYLTSNQNVILNTILVGNNLVNILAASLITDLALKHFQDSAIAAATGITTFFILIFGEIIPKTFARSKAENLVAPVITILKFNYIFLFVVIKPFSKLIELILGDHATLKGRLITKNDIEFMVSQAEQGKSIDSKQLDLLSSILEFPTIKVKDIMVPRDKVVYIDEQLEINKMVKYIRGDIFSRYPVCRGSLDEVLGLIHVKDIAFMSEREVENFDIAKYLKKPFYVYEHMKIQSVFDHMNKKKLHMAFVKDENGLLVGIVTLEDIIEEIVGEIHDEYDDEELEGKIKEDGIEVEGTISLRDLNNDFGVKIPLNDNYSTLAGFLLEHLGDTFPEKGQLIIWEGLSFLIEKVEEQEIKKVKIKSVEGHHIMDERDFEE